MNLREIFESDLAAGKGGAETGRAKGSLLARRRFQFAVAIIVAALGPFAVRIAFGVQPYDYAGINALVANAVAIIIAFWMRLSVETYPGTRQSAIILPAALTGHAVVLVWFLMTRFPYDRVALIAGVAIHVAWLYFIYVSTERNNRTRIAIVPFGDVDRLLSIAGVTWHRLKRPLLAETRDCDAIVADFSADLPDEWEAFLADSALAGRIVYQHKQLEESLTGRVELEHLSENSFGSLVPARGYFHFKALLDFVWALVCLPVLVPVMLVIAIAIRVDSRGPILFRQLRIGHAGRRITVYKFRTMRPVDVSNERRAAMTADDDDRITRVGKTLRKLRLDELPQVFNILKWEMSWIGPRPEAEVLSIWYTSEIPFYRYRHVVKPGISGWAQVNQGHVAEVEEVHRKLQYDFYYVKYFSMWLDALIFVRTVKTMLTGYGSR